ncbi:MAG: hypothetical protein ACI9TV_000732 [Sulfurimonas sp.]|jgi:hypothetical protein|uniref:hypothetical protein n=1 Tax=Sulfurimonas sp. TaxID=2022749 RepID=UPI0039E24B5C
MRFFISILLLSTLFLQADEYELGHGLRLNDQLNFGAYVSTDYETGDDKERFRLDDVAVLAYGSLSEKLSYLLELEAAPFYTKNYTTDIETKDTRFHYERMYVDYAHSELFNIRIGKQISPIGYWNIEPINVLRDTSSNPYYSSKMFPKLLTGLDLYGYLDEDNTLKYHLFMQKNEDLDKNYINIENKHFLGASLEYEVSSEISFGGALGEYITTQDNKAVQFIQFNAKYDNYPFMLQTEIAYNDIDNRDLEIKSHQFAGYTQGLYNFNMQHAIIGRYEYFDNNEISEINQIGIIGYSYRPVYAISIKAEYQCNSDSKLSKSLISFSVLF